ncbi:MAG: hypothetical protein AAFU85_14545 [Planctomycetota bacterium]
MTSAALLTGCPLSIPEVLPHADHGKTGGGSPDDGAPDDGSVASLVARTLDHERRTRGLSTMVNGAWQIFHGILAYGREFEIDTPSGRVPAVDYFASGGSCSGFRPQPGDTFEDQRVGLRVEMQPMTKVGQGHRDQWLAVVAQAGVELDAPWVADDRNYLISDWLRQAEYDLPLNLEEEFSWTLIPLSLYRPSDHSWKARDGEIYSTDLLLESEISPLRDLTASVCGGTHRLIGVAYCVRKRQAEGAAMSGVWQSAQDFLNDAIEMARVNQNPDGSYSTSYLHRAGWCQDLGEMLGTTGHVLEFLSVAAEAETLRSDWVERSVCKLCDVLRQCRGIDLECGVLYHALHGLVEYQRRIS